MDVTSYSRPPVEVEDEPVPERLPVSGGPGPLPLNQWQKLPALWAHPPVLPPQTQDFRDWGINE